MSNSAKFTRQIFLWLAQVNADGKLKPSAVKVAIALVSQFNEAEGGAAWPGIETLGKAMGRSKPVVTEGREQLEARGHLRFQPGSPGSGHSGRYWMILKGNPSLPFEEQEKVTRPYLSEEEKVTRPKWKGNPGLPLKGNPGLHESSTSSKEPSSSSDAAAEEVADERRKADEDADQRSYLSGLLDQCREAAGASAPRSNDITPIYDLIRAGDFDLRNDVLPAMRKVAARGTQVSSWKYYAGMIRGEAQRRANGGEQRAGTGNGHAPPSTAKPAEPDEQRWRRQYDGWVEHGDGWAPPPGDAASEIPLSLALGWLIETSREPDLRHHEAYRVQQEIERIEQRWLPLDPEERERKEATR